MQLNEQRLTSEHREKLKALAASCRDGSRADKISSTQQAAVYANANYLLYDMMCVTCEKADAFMKYLQSYFVVPNESEKEESEPTIEPKASKPKKQKSEPKSDEIQNNQ